MGKTENQIKKYRSWLDGHEDQINTLIEVRESYEAENLDNLPERDELVSQVNDQIDLVYKQEAFLKSEIVRLGGSVET